jgi:hypothetical protein
MLGRCLEDGVTEEAMMKQDAEIDLGYAAIKAGIIGNILAIANSASIFLAGPPGSEIRPMHIPVFLIMIAIGAALLTIPVAIAALLRTGQRAMGLVGIVLGLSPLFVGLLAFMAFVQFFEYKLKD